MSKYDEDIEKNPYLSEHGKYAIKLEFKKGGKNESKRSKGHLRNDTR